MKIDISSLATTPTQVWQPTPTIEGKAVFFVVAKMNAKDGPTISCSDLVAELLVSEGQKKTVDEG